MCGLPHLASQSHTFSGLAGPEEASYGREGAASMSLQAVGRLVVEEGTQIPWHCQHR